MTLVEQAQAAVETARAMLAELDSLFRAPRQEVAQVLACTAELSRILDAQRVRLAGEIAERSKGPDEHSICRLLGHRSPKEAVASAFGVRARDAQALLALAAATRPTVGLTGGEIAIKYPRVAAALDIGALSLAQAQSIVQHLEPAAPRADLEQLAWAERVLVDAATDPVGPLVPELLATQARAYVAVLDPDGVLPDAERQRAMRSLRMRELPDGMWELIMRCPPEAAAAIKAVLDAHTAPRVRVAFRDDAGSLGDSDGPLGISDGPLGDSDGSLDYGDGSLGDRDSPLGDGDGERDFDSDGPVDDRSPEQQRHDVLVALVQAHAASGGAPVAGGEAPVLVLHGDLAAYTAYLQGVAHPDRTLRIEHTGSLVPIETIERLLCEAEVQPVLVDEHLHPLALGRSKRLFTPAQRRALAVRDQGCRVPDCRMPVAWCEAHHIRWWERGGPTDVDNGILVCSYHHHEIHAGRLHVERAGPARGQWRIVPELHPADRYARNPRTGRVPSSARPVDDTIRSIAPAVGIGGFAPAPPGGFAQRRGATGLPAGAPASLAVRLRDARPSPLPSGSVSDALVSSHARSAPRTIGRRTEQGQPSPDCCTGVTPRHAGTVEARLRRLVRTRRQMLVGTRRQAQAQSPAGRGSPPALVLRM